MVHFYFGSGHILEDRNSRRDQLISWCPICWQFLGSRMSFFLTEVENLPQVLPTGEIWSHPRGEYWEVCSLLILVRVSTSSLSSNLRSGHLLIVCLWWPLILFILSFEDLLHLPDSMWLCPITISCLLFHGSGAYDSHYIHQNPCLEYKKWGWRSNLPPLGLQAGNTWFQSCVGVFSFSMRSQRETKSSDTVCVPIDVLETLCISVLPITLANKSPSSTSFEFSLEI